MSLFQKDYPILSKQIDVEVGPIQLPKYPDTVFFNCAITRHQDGRILLFSRRCRQKRISDETAYMERNDIVLFVLNEQMQAISMNEIVLPKTFTNENFEDPRIINFGSHWGLSCCSFVPKMSAAHQCMFLLDNEFRCVHRFDPIYGKNFAQAVTNEGHEKNWLWFKHNGNPHLIYQANPHRVIKMDGGLNKLEEFTSNEFNSNWQYGEVRGGTNPILVDGLYWTFFHSSLPWKDGKRRYFMGAYAFEPQPPFRIDRMTSLPILSGTDKENWYVGLPAVVFPCGSYFEDGKFVVSYGINDIACGYIKIGLREMMDLTIKMRLKRDIVDPTVNPIKELETPSFKRIKTKKKSTYDKLAERLQEAEPEIPAGYSGSEPERVDRVWTTS